MAKPSAKSKTESELPACHICLVGHARTRGDVPFNAASVDNKNPYILGDRMWSSLVGFGSMHPSGINIATADGAVCIIRRTINVESWYAMSGMMDGGLVDSSEFDN